MAQQEQPVGDGSEISDGERDISIPCPRSSCFVFDDSSSESETASIAGVDDGKTIASGPCGLSKLLSTKNRNFLVRSNGDQVLVSQLEGKTIGLLFSAETFHAWMEFISRLIQVYKKLEEKEFEIVLISMHTRCESFDEEFAAVPWLAVPFNDEAEAKIIRYFKVLDVPSLVIIGQDGTIVQRNVAEFVYQYGAQAYPFTTERLADVLEQEKARLESQTLEALLVSDERDFVIGNGGVQMSISELVSKTVVLYFAELSCRTFFLTFIETYRQIKAKDPEGLEVVFLSCDHNEAAFDHHFATMPFLALPFGDETTWSLMRMLKVHSIPKLIVVGPNGGIVTEEGRRLVATHGAAAYPFTAERVKELERQMEKTAMEHWPKQLSHDLHSEHSLLLSCRPEYWCDGCDRVGGAWSYVCEECDFVLHPKCAMEALRDEDEKRENACTTPRLLGR